MAPWPSRLNDPLPAPPSREPPLPPLPRPELEDVRKQLSRPPVRRPVASSSRSNDPNLVDASQVPSDLIPTLPTENRTAPAQRPSSHGRSMSHPFPSLFSAKRKQAPKNPSPDDFDSDSDSDAEMLGLGPGSKQKRPAQPLGPSKVHVKPAGDKDFASGNCMTCGAMSRWPKGLKVFKCTLCMTINDLVDINSAAEVNNHAVGYRRASEDATPSLKAPISPEGTKHLVRDCLRNYLVAALAARRTSTDSKDGGRPVEPFKPHGGANNIDTAAAGRQRYERDEITTPNSGPSETTFGSAEDRSAFVNFSRPGMFPQRSYSSSYPETRPEVGNLGRLSIDQNARCVDPDGKRLFRPLEDYLITCFSPPLTCINSSFMLRHPRNNNRRAPQPSRRRPSEPPRPPREIPPREIPSQEQSITELDAKMLLVGDFAENGSWWTGRKEKAAPNRTPSYRSDEDSTVTSRSPNIDWAEVDNWYHTVINAGERWTDIYDGLSQHFVFDEPTEVELKQIEGHILEAQDHLRKTLLKVTENILKRPGKPINSPEDLRFLLIISANPLLHASFQNFTGRLPHAQNNQISGPYASGPLRGSGPVSGQHSPIIKRILGLLSNTPADCQNHLVSWFARLPESRFIQLKDFAGGFLAYRLIRQHEKKHEVKVDVTAGLIPNMAAGRSPATLHAALGQPRPSRSKKPKEQPKIVYQDDWQTKAAARVIGLLFAANNNAHYRRHIAGTPSSQDEVLNSTSVRDQVQARGQIVPTSDFYITLLDDSDLVADFEAWERKRSKFSFCQFPFLLSIGAKIQILEHDAKRQMHLKARDAFFDSIMSRRNVEQYLTLNVRRDCLVEDSLTGVSEVIGGGGEDIKKGLRIVFQGEEGVDAGGLKKEWFLLLVREVFNPDHGMFVYDEDSQYCYFNPNSFETSDQFFLVGVVFGLAIYNSTILDVAFPPFAFRKLLTAAPPPSQGLSTQPRPAIAYTLDDLAEFRPRLAKGLRQLLDFDGDVESTFCLDFVIDVEKYGYTERVALCPGGSNRPVTNANRREYVDLYVKYLLDSAVTRQFEPFKRGFFTVCGGNALSLFRPEEIELLVRGSDEPLDITSLRVSAEYENWGNKANSPDQTEPTLRWFWESFERASPRDQRRLLAFITGSDRIPAMGAASLTIRISCLGDDSGRYPTARTCFNALQLWRYNSKERLEKVLWDSVHESEGFGLK
ncbi:HECT-domain-containing protein [Diaporthe amygdali]|uniref:HECT-domain-containing protein n=1 Tax=Phomopsis amygdali TaxID=1214568 RepID=UPI0022FE0431|nr:HECT-domain-containing protein [Diaporthe amygdali]KAJ0125354.1 HECT-domain-containing protein [Diaporthe amygdali]